MSSVLDRRLGKTAHLEVSMTPADQMLAILPVHRPAFGLPGMNRLTRLRRATSLSEGAEMHGSRSLARVCPASRGTTLVDAVLQTFTMMTAISILGFTVVALYLNTPKR